MKLNHVISQLLIGSTTLVFGSAQVAAAGTTTLADAPIQGTAQNTVAAATGTLAARAKAAIRTLSTLRSTATSRSRRRTRIR